MQRLRRCRRGGGVSLTAVIAYYSSPSVSAERIDMVDHADSLAVKRASQANRKRRLSRLIESVTHRPLSESEVQSMATSCSTMFQPQILRRPGHVCSVPGLRQSGLGPLDRQALHGEPSIALQVGLCALALRPTPRNEAALGMTPRSDICGQAPYLKTAGLRHRAYIVGVTPAPRCG